MSNQQSKADRELDVDMVAGEIFIAMENAAARCYQRLCREMRLTKTEAKQLRDSFEDHIGDWDGPEFTI